jgi:hypothetical protein
VDPHDYVTEQRVALDSEHPSALCLRDRRHFVVEMIVVRPPRELHMRSWPNEHVDVASDRVSLEMYLGRHALGIRKVDDHVAKEREGHKLALHIPTLRSLTLVEPPSFEDGLSTDEPTPFRNRQVVAAFSRRWIPGLALPGIYY